MSKNIIGKFFILFLVFLCGILWIQQTFAQQQYGVVDTRTFILDGGNDLWKIIPKGVYFEPRIPYTDGKAVQKQFLENINYPWDFYHKRNITPELIKWENPYMYIDWDRPYFIRSLSGIKKVLKGYLFAYRKDWEIFWMDAQNFTPSFMTWYQTKEKQSIIIYPIKNKDTKKIVAFVQYPCWNLVCKDTLCTDLKTTPKCWDGVVNKSIWEQCDYKDPKTRIGCTEQCTYKPLTCKVYNSKEEIYDTNKPYVKFQKDSQVTIDKVYLDKQEFNSVNDINKQTLKPWVYELNATAINKYSWKEFLCESSTFTVVGKEYCWDGVVSWNEQCDYKDSVSGSSCTNTCRFKNETCSINMDSFSISKKTDFKDAVNITHSDNTVIKEVLVNNEKINTNSFIFKDNWSYKIEATIRNNVSWKEYTCNRSVRYLEKDVCGDRKITGYEQCDDWNDVNWDWCSSYCKLEQPTCRINKEWYEFTEWNKYKDYLNLEYKWRYESVQIDDNDVYTSESRFLNTTIKWNSCWTWTQKVKFTVSNPYDDSMTKTCQSTFRIKNKEYCWDGIITGEEQCDIEDPLTWQFCNNSCKFKEATQCNLLWNTLTANETGALVLDTEYFAIPYYAEMDGRKYFAKDWIFTIRKNEPWKYIMKVYMKNKMDKKSDNLKECEFNIVVKENMCRW